MAITTSQKERLNRMNYVSGQVALGTLIENAEATAGALTAISSITLTNGVMISSGTGVPAHSALKGSFYLRTDGASVDEIIYVTTADDTWAAASLS